MGTETKNVRIMRIECGHDSAVVSYYDDRKKQGYLAKLDVNALTFGNGVLIDGNGSSLAFSDNGAVLMIAKEKIISVMPESGETEYLFDLGGFIGMSQDTILTRRREYNYAGSNEVLYPI